MENKTTLQQKTPPIGALEKIGFGTFINILICGNIIDLVTGGVRGIHLYSMNKPDVSKRIWDNIQSIRRFTK